MAHVILFIGLFLLISVAVAIGPLPSLMLGVVAAGVVLVWRRAQERQARLIADEIERRTL